jgi:hypothetical protein
MHYALGDRYSSDGWKHYLRKSELKSKRIDVVVEKQWSRYTTINGKKHKEQYGVLYKFRNEEDRFIFILEDEVIG